MELRKIKSLLIAIYLICSCETHKEPTLERTDIDGKGKALNTSSDPKIGAEFELCYPFFKIDSLERVYKIFTRKSLAYFDLGEKVFEHKSGLIHVHADYCNRWAFSDFKINTEPIDFSKAGLKELEKTCEIIETCFNKIRIKSLKTQGENGVYLYDKTKDKVNRSSLFGKELLKSLTTRNLNDYCMTIGTDLGFKTEEQKAFLLLNGYTGDIVPQITFPMTFEAIYRIYDEIQTKSEDKEEVLKDVSFTTRRLSRYFKSIINSEKARFLLKEKSDDLKLKGFLLLLHMKLYTYVHSMITMRGLKNNSPMLKARNDFASLFKLLPEETRTFLAKDDAKNLRELISILIGTPDLSQPIFKQQIMLKYVRVRRFIAQELSIQEWLINITTGTDLLVKENYAMHFRNTREEEIDELGYAGFGDFGNKTETINGGACGIFEWRVLPSFELKKAKEASRYVMDVAKLIYRLNDMRD